MSGSKRGGIGALVGAAALLLNAGITALLEPPASVAVALAGSALVLCAAAAWWREDFVERGAQHARALHDLALCLSQPLELGAALAAGLRHAAQLTNADAACLYLCDDRGGLRLAEAEGLDPSFAGSELAPDERLQELLRGEAAAAASSRQVPGFLRGMLGPRRIETAVLVPLAAGGAPLGLMCLAYRRCRRFLRDDLETLRAIGAQLASAAANASTYHEALREARTDALTGLGSRRHFEDMLRREMTRARRSGGPLSLAMIDLNGLKTINDCWGHAVGDQVLQTLAELLRGVRGTDVVSRIGGDEFILIMPETDREEAEAAVRRLRERLAEVNAEGRFPFPIGVSAGVRELGSHSLERLLAAVDEAMYRDKQEHYRSGGEAHRALLQDLPAGN